MDAASTDTLLGQSAFPFNTLNIKPEILLCPWDFLQRLAGVSKVGPVVFAPGLLPRVFSGTSQTQSLLEHLNIFK